MISSNDVFTNRYTCFHCEKDIVFDHRDLYTLTFGGVYHPEAFKNLSGLEKRIVFHKECWANVAGEDYMFSGPETK